MQQRRNSLLFSLLICFLTKTNAQITPADSIFSSIKDQPYNLLFPYIFYENQMNKTYFLLRDNNAIKPYDKNNLWVISKNDEPLVGLQLEITKKELDEKAARLKKEKDLECTKPDKVRIEAAKAAEMKFKQTTKTN